MATDDPRCPYCVEGNGFKLLKQVVDAFYCERCSHLSLPADPSFICHCANCERLSSSGSEKRRALAAARYLGAVDDSLTAA